MSFIRFVLFQLSRRETAGKRGQGKVERTLQTKETSFKA